MNKTNIRPFVKWVGGKRQLIKTLDKILPNEINNYYEPFVGGGAIYFYLKKINKIKKTSFLNDLNVNLMTAYKVVKENPLELMNELDKHKSLSNQEYFNNIRKRKPENELDIASRMIYLNKTSWGGVWRENSQGEFNVPFCKDDNKNLYEKNVIIGASSALNDKTKLLSGDYKVIIRKAKKGDFVFIDPPYDGGTFSSYQKDGFGRKEQEELAKEIYKLNKKGVKFITTNHDTPLIRELYSQFTIKTVIVNRNINSNPLNRKNSTKEVYIYNYSNKFHEK